MEPFKTNWLIHIGMPKCASTTFQHLLESSKEVYFNVDSEFSLNGFSHELIAETSKQSVNEFYESFIHDKNKFKYEPLKKYVSLAMESGSKLNVISSETFVSYSRNDIEDLRDFFLTMGIEPRILFITRDKEDYIVSSWKQSIAFGCLMPLADYAQRKSPNFEIIKTKWEEHFNAVYTLKISRGEDIIKEIVDLLDKEYGTLISSENSQDPKNEASIPYKHVSTISNLFLQNNAPHVIHT